MNIQLSNCGIVFKNPILQREREKREEKESIGSLNDKLTLHNNGHQKNISKIWKLANAANLAIIYHTVRKQSRKEQ